MKTQAWPCGCFVKVYVCPQCVKVASKRIRVLRGQLELGILDTEVSVSATEDGGRNGD